MLERKLYHYNILVDFVKSVKIWKFSLIFGSSSESLFTYMVLTICLESVRLLQFKWLKFNKLYEDTICLNQNEEVVLLT